MEYVEKSCTINKHSTFYILLYYILVYLIFSILGISIHYYMARFRYELKLSQQIFNIKHFILKMFSTIIWVNIIW